MNFDPEQDIPEPELHDMMSEWFDSALGQHLLGVETRLLEDILARRFGYHLLELGCANFNMYASSPIGHKFSLAPSQGGNCHEAVARAEALPLGNESVDLVLLHHALDFSGNQHQLLREAARILIAGGDVVVIGFNPYSFWGLGKKLQWRGKPPWQGRMISPLRLTDWLKLLDFQPARLKYGAYSLPFNSPRFLKYCTRLAPLANRLNWPNGGVYVLVARKQVMPLIRTSPSWRRFPAPAGIAAAENIRGASRHCQGTAGKQ